MRRMGRMFWCTVLGGIVEVVLAAATGCGVISAEVGRAAMGMVAAIVASHNVSRGIEDGMAKLKPKADDGNDLVRRGE